MIEIKPANGTLLCEPVYGIEKKNRTNIATVVKAGHGCIYENGARVIFKYGKFIRISLNGFEYYLIDSRDVAAELVESDDGDAKEKS